MGQKNSESSDAQLLPDAGLALLRAVPLIYGPVLVAVKYKHTDCSPALVSAVSGSFLPGKSTEHYLCTGGNKALSHANDYVCRIHADCAHAAILHGRNSVLASVETLQAAG